MRNSCVIKAPQTQIVMLRGDLLEICDGNHCAAALLNHLIYWHDIKLEQMGQSQFANRVSEMHGETGSHYEGTLQWHTTKDLQDAMLGAWGINKIRDSIGLLESKGFVDISNNPNPRYKFDKTKYFQLNPDAVNGAIRLTMLNDRALNLTHGATELTNAALDPEFTLYIKTTSKTTPKTSSSNQETTTAIFSEPTEPAPQRLTAVPSQNPSPSTPVSAAPVIQGVGSAAATRETQLETTPPRDQFGRPQRNTSLVPPLHPVQVGNGTPWLPMAPWTSKEEHDEFAAYLHRSFPGKPEGYYHKIIDRVGKGDFENRSWLNFKAGNSPESMGAALSIPDEWKRLLEAEQRAVSESNPQWSEVDCQLRGLNNFRGKFTYCRNGQESKLGQAADDWALGLLNALKAQSAA